MIEPKFFCDVLNKQGLSFYTGVPDSLLKSFCAYITDNSDEGKHVITGNEGSAIGLSVGHYLGTNSPGVVYMQNSGLGNAINPLLSLADKSVYSVPMLLIIGWRGQPNIKDEPQHFKQGKVTCKLLESIDLPYEILSSQKSNAKQQVEKLVRIMKKESKPVALLVQKGTFEGYKLEKKEADSCNLSREEAIQVIVDAASNNDVFVSTTGKASRELYEYREEKGKSHKNDFLTVGSMGHASQIALGLSLAQKNKKIYCLDGDGALLMHAGSMATIGAQKPENFIHILLNNNVHDSVGAQDITNISVDYLKLALSFNYFKALMVSNKCELVKQMKKIKLEKGPIFLQVMINTMSRKDLGRPSQDIKQAKIKFMKFLKR